jgi:hypothetical protein
MGAINRSELDDSHRYASGDVALTADRSRPSAHAPLRLCRSVPIYRWKLPAASGW